MKRRLLAALGSAAVLATLLAVPVAAATSMAPTEGPNTGGTVVSISGDTLPPFQQGTEVRLACGASAYVLDTVIRNFGSVLEFVTPDVSPFVGACDATVFEPWQSWRRYEPVGQFTFTGAGPTRPADCRDGGWQGVDDFRNQGDCLTFVIANELRAAQVGRVDVDYQLVSLTTDTSGFWPLQPGRTYVTWHMEFGEFWTRDTDGQRRLSTFNLSRQEMWLISESGPGGIPEVGVRITLYGTSDDWVFEVAPPARAVSGSGTVTLRECSWGCPEIGTAAVSASGTATMFLHYAERFPGTSDLGTSFSQVNGWDDSITGQISMDGTVVASGLIGWIQDVKSHGLNIDH